MALKIKIRGYTLIETIIAMVIIMIVFSIAMMIYINVMKTDKIVMKTEVFFKINEILFESKVKNEFTDFTFSFNNYEIQRTIIPYGESKKIKQLTVRALDVNKKIIAEKIELVIDNQNEN